MAGSRIKGITIEIGGNTTGLQKALSNVNKDLRSTQAQLRDVEKLLKADPGNTELLAQRQRLYAQAIEQTKTKLEALKEAEKQAQQQLAEGKISQEQYEGLQREIVATEQSLKKLEDAASQSNDAMDDLSASSKDSADALEDLDQAASKSTKAVDKAGAAIKDTAQDAKEGADMVSTAAGKVTTAVLAATAAVVGAGISYNAELETYTASFETMLGSADKATAVLDQLRTLAASTPFELSDLAGATQLLLNYGFSADSAVASMTMLGDIAQGDADKMTRIATAYGQMSSAGKVTLEDVKQMIEAGFNPLQEITETTGESMASLYERISDGTISVDEITAAMVRSTSEGGKYYQSMARQSKTLQGQWSTLKDTFGAATGKLMDGLSDWLTSRGMPAAIDATEWLGENFEDMIPAIAGVTAGMIALRTAAKFGDMLEDLRKLTTFLGSSAGLIGVATAATLAFAGAVYVGYQRANEGTEAYQELTKSIDKVKDAAADTTQAMDDFDASVADSFATINSTAGPAQEYIDKLKDLEAQGELTEGQQAEWRSLLERLVEIYPELRDQIDLETGSIKDGVGALQDYIETWKEKQALQIFESKYTEALQNQGAAYANLSEQRRNAGAAWQNLQSEEATAKATLDTVNATLGTSYKTLQEAEGGVYALSQSNADLSDSANNLLTPIQDSAQAVDDARSAYQDATSSISDLKKEHDRAKTTADEFGKIMQALASGEITYEEAMARAAEVTNNTTADMGNDASILREKWAQEIPQVVFLVKRCLSEELIAAMHQAGFDFATESNRLVTMSDEELQKLNEDFAQNGDAAVQSLIQSLREGETPVWEAGSEFGGAAAGGTAFGASPHTYYNIGSNAIRGFINGMKSLKYAAFNAAAEIGEGSAKATKKKLRIESPSKLMREYGEYTVEGYILGMEDRRRALEEASTRMASVSLNGFGAQQTTQISNHNSTATFGAINVYASPGQDPQAIARAVMQEIESATNRRGAVFG